MTNKKEPEALRLADELEEPLHDFPEPTTLEAKAAAELRRLHAENETLRAGYAAARLEIESLKAQSAGAQPAAQPSYEHQRAIMEGERNASLDAYSRVVSITSAESRLYERAFTSGWDRRDRLASYGQAPAQPAPAPLSDPLQGAANWLVTAHSALETSTLAGKLSIGYNRAKRLHDAALAAQGGTKA